jgi:hypothetical protein
VITLFNFRALARYCIPSGPIGLELRLIVVSACLNSSHEGEKELLKLLDFVEERWQEFALLLVRFD